MGARLSSSQPAANTATSRAGRSHRYDPNSEETYFASQYYLGHRRFETGDPELFLFGELTDLNYLPDQPVAFPYKQPPKNKPGRCLRSYINLQRDTIKVKKCGGSQDTYNVQFMFDSDVDCQFTIYNHLPDSVGMETLVNGPYEDEGAVVSQQYQYSAGTGCKFSEPSYTVTPGEFPEEKRAYNPEGDSNTFPFAVLMETTSTDDALYQAQLSICSLDKINDNGYSIKVTKQKLWVEGVEYLLQEVYGIENKLRGGGVGGEGGEGSGDELDADEVDLGAECVICMTDPRDTLLLPCRHLCLCSGCAGNLRYQSSNCPICRAPFRALLQIQALEPLDPEEDIDDDSATGDPKYSIPGFRVVPLLQALNGYPVSHDDDSEDDPGLVEPEDPVEPDTLSAEPQQQTTEFCVIPEEELATAAAAAAQHEGGEGEERRDKEKEEEKRQELVKPTVRKTQYEISEEDIPLPGTPTSDTGSFKIKLSDGGQGKRLELSVSLDPVSPCSSSVSSEQSAKSNDLLLPGNKAGRNDDQ